MAETNILDQIRKLVDLQKIDTQVYAVKRELQDKPALLKQLEQQFEVKKARLKELEAKFKASQVSRNSFEVELKAQEDAITKANNQLSLLKTNKEYSAKMTEIEGFKALKSQIEEKILLLYDEADGVKTQIDQEKAVLLQEEAHFSKSRQEIEALVKELSERLKILTAQRGQKIVGIDKINLQRYERILANKDGLAIVPLQNNACGGCYMNVPPQVANEIKLHERLIYCEMCARVLYLDGEL